MSGRGGSRKVPITAVDVGALQEVIDLAVTKFKDKAFYFGDYDTITVNMAASGSGLLQCQWWLKKLLPMCSGEILPWQLKNAIRKHAGTHNNGQYRHDLWSANQAARITVVLNHWRRLKYNAVKRRQALQKLGKIRQGSLEALLALSPGLKACNKAKGQSPSKEACKKAKSPAKGAHKKAKSPAKEACKKAKSPAKEACKKASQSPAKDACKKATSMTPDKKASNMAAISPVSLDSEGYPRMLSAEFASGMEGFSGEETCHSGLKQSPGSGSKKGHAQAKAESSGLKKSQSSSQKNTSLPLLSKKAKIHRQALEAQAAAAMETVAQESVSNKNKKKGASSKKRPAACAKRPAACAKRPAAHVEVQGSPAKKRHETMPEEVAAEGLERKPGLPQSGWERYKKETYTQQSYLRGFWNGKWHLLVACNVNQARDFPGGHHAVINALEPYCQEPGMTKEKLLQERAKLLKAKEA